MLAARDVAHGAGPRAGAGGEPLSLPFAARDSGAPGPRVPFAARDSAPSSSIRAAGLGPYIIIIMAARD